MESFFEGVYRLVRTVPHGKVTTYGEIARALGNPRASRAVGYALHVNPDPEGTPCYRVVNRSGGLASGFAFGGEDVQRLLLEADGIPVENGKVDLGKFFFPLSASPASSL